MLAFKRCCFSATRGALRSRGFHAAQIVRALPSHTGAVPPEPEPEGFELQPQWKSLESRLNSRKPKTSGPTGRANIKKSDEDYWQAAGVYDDTATDKQQQQPKQEK
jgi:hypothetical protein